MSPKRGMSRRRIQGIVCVLSLAALGALAGVSGCRLVVPTDPCNEGEKRCHPDTYSPQECVKTGDEWGQWRWKDPCGAGSSEPVCSAGECVGIETVAAGGSATCAILKDQSIRCWGMSLSARCGVEASEAISAQLDCCESGAPRAVVPEPVPIKDVNDDNSIEEDLKFDRIAVGGDERSGHACAVTAESNRVFCWGDNAFGQAGELGPDDEDCASPNEIPAKWHKDGWTVRSIHAGLDRSCVIVGPKSKSSDARDELWCWGRNNEGQTLPSVDPSVSEMVGTPRRVALPDGNLLHVTLGREHTCALVGATVYCWGDPRVIGGSPEAAPLPAKDGQTVHQMQIDDTVLRVTAGGYHTCALTTSGLRCWGDNSCGQVGAEVPPECADACTDEVTPNAACRATFNDIPAIPSVAIDDTEVAAGALHTCIALSSGEVRCWGHNRYSQVKASAGPIPSVVPDDSQCATKLSPFSPIAASQSVSGASTLAQGDYHACVLVSGHLECWGRNDVGQLGRGRATCAEGAPDIVVWSKKLCVDGQVTDVGGECVSFE